MPKIFCCYASILFASILCTPAQAESAQIMRSEETGDSTSLADKNVQNTQGPNIESDAERRNRLKEELIRIRQERERLRRSPVVLYQRSARTYMEQLHASADAKWEDAINIASGDRARELPIPDPFVCVVDIFQTKDGVISNVKFVLCPYASDARQFVTGVFLTKQLPLPGTGDVFSERIRLAFCHPKIKCSQDQ